MEEKEKTNQEIKARLLEFAERQKIPKTTFFGNIDFSSSNFYGRNSTSSISTQKLIDIINFYPNLNLFWLLTGEGNMLNNGTQTIENVRHSTMTGVNVKGNGININSEAYNSLLKIVEQYQYNVTKFQEQIDRLLNLLEQKSEQKCAYM